MAISPLTWSDIDAYLRRFRQRAARWELEALSRLDGLFMRATDPSNETAVTGAKALNAALKPET